MEKPGQAWRWALLSCAGFPVIASIAYQVWRSIGIASRGIEAETVARKFLIGFVVDLATLVGLAAVLSLPLILAARHLPSRVDWMVQPRNRKWLLVLGIVVWQLPVSALASYLLDAPSMGTIALVGVLSLVTPLLFRSVRPTLPTRA